MDNDTMKEQKVTIQNKLGLHARAAASFSKQASEFISDVFVTKDRMQVNGKSIMELLTLAATRGSNIIIKTHGDDEAQAIKTLAELVKQGFGES